MRKEITKTGTIRYFNENNEILREDGPAIEYSSGTKEWYKNGKLHREGGPAAEHSDGSKFWYIDGKHHREDGPASEYTDGDKRYLYNNIWYTEIKTDEEWVRFVKLMVFQ